jgi:hypothetical protein
MVVHFSYYPPLLCVVEMRLCSYNLIGPSSVVSSDMFCLNSMNARKRRIMQMSQQHAQFEGEFRDGPQPTPSYQEGYSGPQPVSYTVNVPPVQTYVPGQKLLAYDLQSGRAPGPGARLALAIVSLVFTFIMFIVALVIIGTSNFYTPLSPLAILFALIFAAIVLIINLIFNRRH